MQRYLLDRKDNLVVNSDGQLFYVDREGNHALVIGAADRQVVLKMMHETALSGGHQGLKHTYERVSRHYWWPYMHRDVEHWVRSCQTCQMHRRPTRGLRTKGYRQVPK